jgi:hypothetical protein
MGMSEPRNEPEREETLNPAEALTPPDYYFGYGVGEHNQPSLEAVKTWMEGDERRFDTFTIAEYGSYDEAGGDEDELNSVLETRGVEAAIQLAEGMAVAGGYLDAERADGRVFFADDAPADPFVTLREQALDLETLSAEPQLTYDFAVLQTDPEMLELVAQKMWVDELGQAGIDELVLQTYELPPWAIEAETERERALMERETLIRLQREAGIAAALQRAEALAVASGELAADRAEPGLFTAGPPDPIQRGEGLEHAKESEATFPLLDITDDETQELPAATPEPGSWDDLIERERIRAAQPEPERESSYWRLDARPLESPEGKAQGYGLFITVFPELPADFDQYVEEHGIDDSIYPTEARRLEIARFETEAAAEKYAKEFRGYLIPGLLDGPELAEEAAKLEGMPGTWEGMDVQDITRNLGVNRTIADHGETRSTSRNSNLEVGIMPNDVFDDSTSPFAPRDEVNVSPEPPELDF